MMRVIVCSLDHGKPEPIEADERKQRRREAWCVALEMWPLAAAGSTGEAT